MLSRRAFGFSAMLPGLATLGLEIGGDWEAAPGCVLALAGALAGAQAQKERRQVRGRGAQHMCS